MNLARGLLLILITAMFTACATEERVISVKGGLHGVPGAKSNLGVAAKPVTTGVTVEAMVNQFHEGSKQLELGEEVKGWPNRRQLEDGSLYLISRSPGELITHLFETTIDGDWDLMYDQLIADEAKDNYRQANRDPKDIIRFLRQNRVELVALLRAMNYGEHTPGVDFKPLQGNIFRLHSPQAVETMQRFSTMEMVLEDGRMKLLVIR